MKPVLIYFREVHLGENNKFTFDFSDQEFVHEIEFLSENTYYIASLNCKLKLKVYIHEGKTIEKLSEKSRLLLDKGAVYLCDNDYLTLVSDWYIRPDNNIYKLKLDPKIIDNYSYKYKFWDTKEKKIRDGQMYSPYSQLLGKGFNLERDAIKDMNLIVRLNEKQTLLESFLLHGSTQGGTEYLNYYLGKYYYRDINLFFVYDQANKQWFTSGAEFFNEAIWEKVRNKNFNLTAFARQYYYVDKKGNGYAIGHMDQRNALGDRKYLMSIIEVIFMLLQMKYFIPQRMRAAFWEV